eukprot:Em0110g16a
MPQARLTVEQRATISRLLKTPDAAKRMKWAEDFLDAVELDYTYPEMEHHLTTSLKSENGETKNLRAGGWDGQDPYHGQQEAQTCPPLDFWLWGYLKNKVHSHSVATLQEWRDAIEDELPGHPSSDGA